MTLTCMAYLLVEDYIFPPSCHSAIEGEALKAPPNHHHYRKE